MKVRRIGIGLIIGVLLCSLLANVVFGSQEVEVDRIVTVMGLADEEYVEQYGTEWQEELRALIEKASLVFEKEFGIKLEIEGIKRWTSETKNSSIWGVMTFTDDTLWQSLIDITEIDSKNCELVIALTAEKEQQREELIMWSAVGMVAGLRGRYILVKEGKEADYTLHILVHELGHVFGAIHTSKEVYSVMNTRFVRKFKTYTVSFDKPNKELIVENKYGDLREIERLRKEAEKYEDRAERILRYGGFVYGQKVWTNEMGLIQRGPPSPDSPKIPDLWYVMDEKIKEDNRRYWGGEEFLRQARTKFEYQGKTEEEIIWKEAGKVFLKSARSYKKVNALVEIKKAGDMYIQAAWAFKKTGYEKESKEAWSRAGQNYFRAAELWEIFNPKSETEIMKKYRTIGLYTRSSFAFFEAGEEDKIKEIEEKYKKLDRQEGYWEHNPETNEFEFVEDKGYWRYNPETKKSEFVRDPEE